MSKIAILDDYEAYSQMIAAPLNQAGHETLIALVPIDFERVLDFGPDVIVVALYRKEEAFERPIRDPAADLIGYEALCEMERYPAINLLPIVLLGHGVSSRDVPTHVRYDCFLSFPHDINNFPSEIETVAAKVKSRRKISGYVCPICGNRLTFSEEPVRDLFCPKDGTAVAIINPETALVTGPDGASRHVALETLMPPPKDER
ncbi:hypothetical protein J7643_00355 [bacterium]|nr:hypothetical protein [bacterium]